MSNIVLKNTLVPLKDPSNPSQNFQFIDTLTIGTDAFTSSKLQTALTECDNLATCGGVQISESITSPPPNTLNSTIKYIYTLIQLPTVDAPSTCGLQYFPNRPFTPSIIGPDGSAEPMDRYAMMVNQSDCNAQPFIPQNAPVKPAKPKPAEPTGPDYYNTPPAATPENIWDNPLIYVGIAVIAIMLILCLGMMFMSKSNTPKITYRNRK